MQHAVFAIFMLLAVLLIGWGVGTQLPLSLRQLAIKSLSSIVLLLLLSMGLDFAEVFSQSQIGGTIIYHAALLAGLTTLITGGLLFRKPNVVKNQTELPSLLSAFGGCLKAISAFILGLAIGHFTHFTLGVIGLSSNSILYLMLFCVGIDLVGFRVTTLTRQLVTVPLLALLGYVIAALLFSSITNFTWQQSLLVASGLGWFSLSGPMVHQLVDVQMGALAFMTDFFRELLSIVFLYFFGRRQPLAAVGLSGAAAMDSALPFIKQNCDAAYIPYAIFSGLVLTLTAPFLITLVATLL
ncbi:lysine exporter LysO family protein [Rosenbergiella australiborealis]|uniref:Lysine exporter LysO family protein n=1 Tax=Rosenbergiella australiborealis TaxID=1544696 RepID=A0ABS5T2T6_9GAMM|nr:lysine exporter LysO family protein [Rosenbergiella australiborealis]MBT0726667.1 lysine exporter LysO family protein [Rosenbergiella australiborealis]